MKAKKDPLNQKLLSEFPLLQETYTEVKEGTFDLDTPSSAFYQEIFVPYFANAIRENNEREILHCASFVEAMLRSDDELSSNVVTGFVLLPLAEIKDIDLSKVPFGKKARSYLVNWVYDSDCKKV